MRTPAGNDWPEVFISYASQDRPRVLEIVRVLEQAGVSVWLDRDRILGSQIYGPEIVRAIGACTVVLVMCTDAALRSRNVAAEIRLAWEEERPYLPLLLQPTTF